MTSYHQMRELLIGQCRPYLIFLAQLNKPCILVRSIRSEVADIKLCVHDLEERVPRKVHISIHQAVNRKTIQQFNWPVRNGVFTRAVRVTTGEFEDSYYGKSYFIFPVGDFVYAYDPNIYDLLEYSMEQKGTPFDEMIENVKYQTNGLESKLNECFVEDQSVEISIKCSSYFLVNFKYKDIVLEIIEEVKRLG